jgi:hypothetical protein
MHYAIAFAVTIIGSMVAGEDGLFYGALLGFGGALLWQQRKQLRELQARVEGLAAAVGAATEPTPAAAASPQDSRSETAPTVAPATDGTLESSRSETTPTAAPAPAPMRPLPELAPRPREPSAIEASINNAVDAFKHWLTSGNMVVRVGVVVLFFGVAFLLRYAYEQALLPVELRLTGAALGGIVLVMAGWRLRHRSDAYGTVLQGAGVGILYLTIFAAARLYELIPLSAAFGLLLALVAASSVLAVLQNAQSLAIFSMSGGFLAPVLVSTGAGSHVALFSYYALLNGGILAMAWFKHWRWLNWVGFLFTFAIGATWGYQYYKPEFFATTEPLGSACCSPGGRGSSCAAWWTAPWCLAHRSSRFHSRRVLFVRRRLGSPSPRWQQRQCTRCWRYGCAAAAPSPTCWDSLSWPWPWFSQPWRFRLLSMTSDSPQRVGRWKAPAWSGSVCARPRNYPGHSACSFSWLQRGRSSSRSVAPWNHDLC